MKNIKCITTFITILVLSGCKSSRMIGGWCSISASADPDKGKDAAINALVFEEYKGVLIARIVNCRGREYYIGSSPSSRSSVVIPVGYRQTDMRWDGRLSCNDAQAAYPQDAPETADLLRSLCTEVSAPLDPSDVDSSLTISD